MPGLSDRSCSNAFSHPSCRQMIAYSRSLRVASSDASTTKTRPTYPASVGASFQVICSHHTPVCRQAPSFGSTGLRFQFSLVVVRDRAGGDA